MICDLSDLPSFREFIPGAMISTTFRNDDEKWSLQGIRVSVTALITSMNGKNAFLRSSFLKIKRLICKALNNELSALMVRQIFKWLCIGKRSKNAWNARGCLNYPLAFAH
jgi:hypothetical protein